MMFGLVSIAAILSSALALPDISASSALGKRLLERALANNNNNNNAANFDVSWMPNYSLRFYGCYQMPSFDYQTQGILNETLVRFKLCPSGSCSAGCSGGDYVVQASTFVNAYTEAKLNAFQYNCEILRESCANNCTNLVTQYYTEDTCMTNCYSNAGWSNCTNDGMSSDDQLVQQSLGCQKIKDANGNVYYTDVICGDKGSSIHMAVFSDQYCSVLASSDVFAEATGSSLPYTGTSLVGTDCISCSEPSNAADQNNQDKNDQDKALASCQNLYYTAGKCESSLASVTTTPTTDACEFIVNSLPAVAKSSTTFKGSSSNSGSGTAAKVFATFFFLTTLGLAGYVFFLIQNANKRSAVKLNDNLA
jgi:hypothetical protein